MVTVVRCAVLLGFFAACGACDDRARVTAPSAGPAPPPPVTETPLPPLEGAATTFSFRGPLENFGSYRVSALTEGSSFVLYASGGFYLRYQSIPHPYRGRYARNDERVAFYFSERSSTPDAIGTMKGNLLEVRYSELMQHSDFENAVYTSPDHESRLVKRR